MARSGSATTALASPPSLFVHLHIMRSFTLTPPPLRVAVDETPTTLRPLDHRHRDHLTAGYRPGPSPSSGATALAAGKAVLSTGSHGRRHLSSYFPAPASSLRRVRPPRSLPLVETKRSARCTIPAVAGIAADHFPKRSRQLRRPTLSTTTADQLPSPRPTDRA